MAIDRYHNHRNLFTPRHKYWTIHLWHWATGPSLTFSNITDCSSYDISCSMITMNVGQHDLLIII